MVQTFPTISNTDNYRIGLGKIYWKDKGSTLFRFLGECPSLTYTPSITTKDHYSHTGRVKKKDKSRITQMGATIKFVMTECTAENMAFFFLSTVETGSDGEKILRGLSKTTFEGELYFVGYNEAGRQVDARYQCSFKPSGDFAFIDDSDDYAGITVDADVLEDENGDYGIVTDRGLGTGNEPTVTS